MPDSHQMRGRQPLHIGRHLARCGRRGGRQKMGIPSQLGEKIYPCEVGNVDAVCSRFAEALASTNPRFNRQKFIAACSGKGGS